MIALKPTPIEASYIGTIEYRKAYELQRNLWSLAKDKHQISIVGLEHPAVMTLGRRIKDINAINNQGLPVVQSTRGGLITVHSQGQLVIYPIVHLRQLKLSIKEFVFLLLRTTREVLLMYGLETYQDEKNVGLYTDFGKIAFCGLEVKDGISLHGISINISNDLDLFSKITSCGVSNLKTDRLVNYNSDVTLRDFFNRWSAQFKKNIIHNDCTLVS